MYAHSEDKSGRKDVGNKEVGLRVGILTSSKLTTPEGCTDWLDVGQERGREESGSSTGC